MLPHPVRFVKNFFRVFFALFLNRFPFAPFLKAPVYTTRLFPLCQPPFFKFLKKLCVLQRGTSLHIFLAVVEYHIILSLKFTLGGKCIC